MHTAQSLLQVVEEIQQGWATTNELLDSCLGLTQTLEEERLDLRQYLSEMDPSVNHLARAEIHATESSQRDFLEALDYLTQDLAFLGPPKLQWAQENIPGCVSRLELDLFRLSQALDAAAGPTAHGGVNRLLVLEDQPELLGPALAVELRNLELERSQDPQTWPELTRPAQAAVLEELHQWMLHPQPDDPDWWELGEELGFRFGRVDLMTFFRHYGAGPTSLAHLNVIHNGLELLPEGLIHKGLLVHCLDMTAQALEEQGDPAHLPLLNLLDAAYTLLDQPNPVSIEIWTAKLRKQAADLLE